VPGGEGAVGAGDGDGREGGQTNRPAGLAGGVEHPGGEPGLVDGHPGGGGGGERGEQRSCRDPTPAGLTDIRDDVVLGQIAVLLASARDSPAMLAEMLEPGTGIRPQPSSLSNKNLFFICDLMISMVAFLHRALIYGGTSEIMKTIIAREVTGMRA
jgi:hypothetical protein